MPLFIGLIIIPFIILIIRKANLITTKKPVRILLNLSLILISLIYIIFCWIVRQPPFDFEDHYSVEYMIFEGEYILYSGLIFAFTPFMWIVLIHFLKKIFSTIRVRKNAIIKQDEEYIYYRGDLDKISPSIIMFASTFEVDLKKSISATILKLKLTGYIEEKEGALIYTNKDEANLLDSEKMVLNLIRNNNFDKNKYIKIIEQETLKNKYIAKNGKGKPFRILKIIFAIFIPIMAYNFSMWLDQYSFNYYNLNPEDDGHAYICLEKEEDIENLYYNEIKDENDYYHSKMYDGSWDYNYKEIRADKLEYSVVRKALLLNILGTFMVGFIEIFAIIALYIIIEQIIYINKNYRRTLKGKALLNKAYALKNYLKKYSLIKDRTEEELVLWEYYLVYAVILDVNVKIDDEIIEKYVKNNV